MAIDLEGVRAVLIFWFAIVPAIALFMVLVGAISEWLDKRFKTPNPALLLAAWIILISAIIYRECSGG
jgi:uncharacterized membrane protein YoaK (UPF0700 family)